MKREDGRKIVGFFPFCVLEPEHWDRVSNKCILNAHKQIQRTEDNYEGSVVVLQKGAGEENVDEESGSRVDNLIEQHKARAAKELFSDCS